MEGLPSEIFAQIAAELHLPCGNYWCSEDLDPESNSSEDDAGTKDVCFHRPLTWKYFCLTSKSCYSRGIPELYRSVHIDARRLRYFLSAVLENRSLAAHVEELRYSFETYRESLDYRTPLNGTVKLPEYFRDQFRTAAEQSGFEWDEAALRELDSGSADAEATLLLQVLPNLAKLDLEFPKISPDSDDQNAMMGFEHKQGLFSLDRLRAFLNLRETYPQSRLDDGKHRPLANLRRIRLVRPFLEPWSIKSEWPRNVFWEMRELSGVFWLNRLQSLSIDRCITYDSFETGLPDMPLGIQEIAGTSDLEDICITSAALSPAALDMILSLPRSLKRFRYGLADSEHILQYPYEDEDLLNKIKYFKPRLLFAGLQSHKDSLQSLDLSTFSSHPGLRSGEYFEKLKDEADAETWRRYISKMLEPIDVHDFAALKHLCVNTIDLLGTEILYEYSAYDRFVQVLPPNLEVLELFNAYQLDETGVDGLPRPPYDHIADLLRNKGNRFRKLRRVVMTIHQTWPLPDEELYRQATSVDVHFGIKRIDDYGYSIEDADEN